MAKDTEVANLTAPIKITIPKKQIDAFQKQLDDIADTLEYIAVQFKDIDKVATRTFKDTSKGIKIVNQQNNKWVTDNRQITRGVRKINRETKKAGTGAKRLAKAWGFVPNAIAQARVQLGLLQFAMSKIFQMVAVPTAFFGGFAFLGAKVTEVTTEMSSLSEAVRFNMNDLRGLGLAAEEMGFTFEHVGSLIEELNNKMGGEKTGEQELLLREAFKGLNLEFEKLNKMSPEKQFETIMDAGAKLAKDGKWQELATSYDKLFGQEANRMLSRFNQQMLENGMTFREFNDHFSGFVAISERAEEGAKTFSGLWKKGLATVRRGFETFFGRIGAKLSVFQKIFEGIFQNFGSGLGEMSTYFEDLFIDTVVKGIQILVDLKNWIIDNQEAIKKFGKDSVTALTFFFNLGIKLFQKLRPYVIWALDKFNELSKTVGVDAVASFLLLVGAAAGLIVAFTAVGKAIAFLTSLFTTIFGVISKLYLILTNLPAVMAFVSKSWVILTGVVKASAIAFAPMLGWAAILFGIAAGAKAVYEEFDEVKRIVSDVMTGGFGKYFDKLYGVTDEEMAQAGQLDGYDLHLKKKRAMALAAKKAKVAGTTSTTQTDNSSSIQNSNNSTNQHFEVQINDSGTGQQFLETIPAGSPNG